MKAAGFEHGAGDVEEAVGDRRSALPLATLTSASEFGIFGAAARIVLNGDTRPVVDGVGEAVVANACRTGDTCFGPLMVTGATPARLRKAA